jgi:mono/diheme cytochrome c family protein
MRRPHPRRADGARGFHARRFGHPGAIAMTSPARMPWGWIVALGGVGLVAGLGIAMATAGGVPAPPAPPLPDDGAVDPGRAAYVACQGCHQGDGRGLAGFAPPLAGSALATGAPEAAIRAVLDGVAGDGAWRSTMAPQRERLDDAQVAAVLGFVRGQWGNRAGAVDAGMVAAVRGRGAHAPWTRAELAGMATGLATDATATGAATRAAP